MPHLNCPRLPLLETDRLILRPFTQDDFDFMRELDTDPEVVKYLGHGGYRPPEETTKNLEKIFSDYEKYGLSLYLVEEKTTGKPIGRSGLIPYIIEDQLYWEVAYTFARSSWGQGFATEAASFLAKWGAKNIKTPFLISLIHPQNEDSMHVARKAGLTFWKTMIFGEKHISTFRIITQQVQAVMVILEKDGKFLLGKRSEWKQNAPGYWCPVSGKIESGETEAQAVEREVIEEVGLKVMASRKCGEMDSLDGLVRLHWWKAEILSGEAILSNNEHSELGWFTWAEMEKLTPIFKEDLEFMKAIYLKP